MTVEQIIKEYLIKVGAKELIHCDETCLEKEICKSITEWETDIIRKEKNDDSRN